MIIPWSTQYARSLSEAQWEEEIGTRFFEAIRQQIESAPFREPLRSFLEKLNVDFRGEHAFLFSWDIYTASLVGDKSDLTFTAWCAASTYRWDQSKRDTEIIWSMEDDDESKTFMIAFDGRLRIDDTGGLGSQINEICTDPDLTPDWYAEEEDFIHGAFIYG